MRIDRPLGGAAVPGATFRRVRFCAPRRSTGHREPVAVVGCITLLMMYSPIWRPISVPTRVEKPVGSGSRPRCGRSQSRRQRHRGWVQRCATPGAVKLVIEISGMSVEPSTDSMTATAAPLSMHARPDTRDAAACCRSAARWLAFLAGLRSRSPLRIAAKRRAQHRRAAWHLVSKATGSCRRTQALRKFLENRKLAPGLLFKVINQRG